MLSSLQIEGANLTTRTWAMRKSEARARHTFVFPITVVVLAGYLLFQTGRELAFELDASARDFATSLSISDRTDSR